MPKSAVVGLVAALVRRNSLGAPGDQAVAPPRPVEAPVVQAGEHACAARLGNPLVAVEAEVVECRLILVPPHERRRQPRGFRQCACQRAIQFEICRAQMRGRLLEIVATLLHALAQQPDEIGEIGEGVLRQESLLVPEHDVERTVARPEHHAVGGQHPADHRTGPQSQAHEDERPRGYRGASQR